MDILIVSKQVATLFLIMLAGFAARKKGIITEEVNNKLSDILLNITSPSLILSSFMIEYTREKLVNAVYVFGFGALIFVISIALGELVYLRENKDSKPVLKTSVVFSNCGYMGFPMLDALFGKEGVFYGSMFVVVFTVFQWTYGMIAFSLNENGSNRKAVARAFASPAMIAVYLGFPLFLLRWRLPEPLYNALDMVGSMNMPLAMMIIGAIFAQSDLRGVLKDARVYLGSFLRLVLMPLLALGLVRLSGVPEMAASICVTVTAMPVAVIVAVFAERYGKNPLLGSKMVMVSTLLSIFTIPLVLSLLK